MHALQADLDLHQTREGFWGRGHCKHTSNVTIHAYCMKYYRPSNISSNIT